MKEYIKRRVNWRRGFEGREKRKKKSYERNIKLNLRVEEKLW